MTKPLRAARRLLDSAFELRQALSDQSPCGRPPTWHATTFGLAESPPVSVRTAIQFLMAATVSLFLPTAWKQRHPRAVIENAVLPNARQRLARRVVRESNQQTLIPVPKAASFSLLLRLVAQQSVADFRTTSDELRAGGVVHFAATEDRWESFPSRPMKTFA